MKLFRLFFMPQFGLGRFRGSGRRLAESLSTLLAPAGPARLGRLFVPAGRAAGGAGIALAAAGGILMAYGIAGFEEAAAQSVDPGLFGVEDEGTRKILAFLSDFDSADSPVLGQMLFVFNAGVMVLAGYLLVWHTLTGAVDTATEGRWKFGAWQILRIVIAVALMAPLPGGASGAQHIVIGLAKVGGDFANLVWRPLAVNTLGKGRAVVPWPREAAWRTVIARTLVSEVCMHVANGEAARAGDRPYVAVRVGEEIQKDGAWVKKPPPGRVALGGIRLGTAPPVRAPVAEARHYDGVGGGMPNDMCGAVRFVGLREDGVRGIAARGHMAAWRAVHPSVVRVARKIGDHFLLGNASSGQRMPDAGAELDSFGVQNTYRALLEVNLKAAGDAEQRALVEAVAEDAEDISWLAAASFVNTLSISAGRIQAAADNVPEAALPSPSLAKWSERASAAVQGIVRSLGHGGSYQAVPLVAGPGVDGSLVPGVGKSGFILEKVMSFIDPETVVVADSGNPLLDLTTMGYRLMNAGLGALGVLTGLSAGSSLTGVVGLDFFRAAWVVMEGIVSPVIGMIIVAGAVLAYVMPAIPFIRFLFGILQWLLAIVEAMLAVTVFCAAHVKRGEENRLDLPETRHGWMFFPGLILRPVLMLFGFVVGYFVFVTVVGLFNEVWVPRMVDINASGGLGVIDFAAMLVLYVIVVYGLLNACFKLIDILPQAVLAWIGGHGGGDAGGDSVMGVATAGMGRAGGFRAGFGAPRGAGGSGGAAGPPAG